MNEFNAFLMPFSFLRRWDYNELIPALLYFDRVTFLMDDIEPQYIDEKYKQPDMQPVRLWSPDELAGMEPNEFVDGLSVEQHRYYWPMRDLMKEEVLAISSSGLGPLAGEEPRQKLKVLLEQNNEMALAYESYANQFYNVYMPFEQRSLTRLDKAMEVYSWINYALRWRPGWQRVTLHPNAYRSLLASLSVFPELLQLYLDSEIDRSGRASMPPAQSYLAMRVVGTLMEEKLNSFVLKDDPNALSEILEVRQKYSAELQAFRAKMAEATNEWALVDTDVKDVPAKVEGYIQKVYPEFESTRRVLSDKSGNGQLLLRKGGTWILIGACAGIGAALGTAFGPTGTIAGGTLGAAAPDFFKAIFKKLGEEGAKKLEPESVTIDKSLVYLFHVETALSK